MSLAGERLTLEAFLTRVGPQIGQDLGGNLTRAHEITGHLTAHLSGHPEIAAQVAKLAETLPHGLADTTQADRTAAAQEAARIAADIKERWIAADAPPLVDEIDDILNEINTILDQLRRPGTSSLEIAAQEIDRLARQAAPLDGIEARYVPWALGTGALFLFGLVLFFRPDLLEAAPILASPWTILACFAGLPAVAIHYARRVLPRTQADTRIDALNREHFLPNGGLYFPAGDQGACVVLVQDPRPPSPREQALEERRQTRDKSRPNW